ncbi:MAG: 50S ribosomal protein L11 methyltransferase [Actinomycetota bacterium]
MEEWPPDHANEEGFMTGRLTPDTVLRRAPDVRVRIDSSNNIRVYSEEAVYHLGPHGLAILDAFYQPTTMSRALERLGASVTGRQDWMSLTTTIMQLYEAGVLLDESQRTPKLETGKLSFGGPDIHIGMLNDRLRTSAFLSGISEVVRSGDVVVDIGTGTGVLAIAAARAGARHVYAIEASAIGETAQRIFEANGLEDRITLLRGWSTRLTLPERADVLVSEIIGNEPLGEDVLEITSDARQRLLKPGARMVPGRIRIFGLPVTIPEAEIARLRPTDRALQDWRSWYGIDFTPLSEMAGESASAFFVKPQKAHGWRTLSDPILLAEVDLREVERPLIDSSIVVSADASGDLNGLLVYFELELGPTTRLSTHPARVDENCSWHDMVWNLEPLRLGEGDRFEVTYRYRATGTSHEVSVSRA